MNSSELLNHPAAPYVAAAVAIGVTALSGLSYCFSKRQADPDLQTIQKLSREILDLKPTIGDAGSYDFVATHKKKVVDESTKAGSLSMLAAGLRAHARKESYGDSPTQVIELGRDLLKTRSGQCDHMAASVIAKVAEHIRKGGAWNSDLELVGNGGHAFAIMNRQGHLNNPSTWGKKAVIIDTWLGVLGVNDKSKHELTAGQDGVVSKRDDVIQNAKFFGEDRLHVTCKFTAEELNRLAAE